MKGFSLAWKTQLDGGITASPLAAPVAGHGLVTFASAEKGNVYAVRPTGRVLRPTGAAYPPKDGSSR